MIASGNSPNQFLSSSIRHEVAVRVRMHHVESLAIGVPQKAGHRGRDIVTEQGHAGVDPVDRVPVGFLDPRQRVVLARREHRHVVAHRRLVATHRVDVIVAAALRVGIDPRRDTENSHYAVVPDARVQTYRFGLVTRLVNQQLLSDWPDVG